MFTNCYILQATFAGLTNKCLFFPVIKYCHTKEKTYEKKIGKKKNAGNGDRIENNFSNLFHWVVFVLT